MTCTGPGSVLPKPQRKSALHRLLVAGALTVLAVSCGGADEGANGSGANKARFTFDCNIAGFPGALTLDLEAVGQSGITWGPGPNPSITGVIGTGDYTIYTTGSLSLPDRTYSISGENYFADLWSSIPGDRLTVEWQPSETTLIVVWDWFGAATPYACELTGSRLL